MNLEFVFSSFNYCPLFNVETMISLFYGEREKKSEGEKLNRHPKWRTSNGLGLGFGKFVINKRILIGHCFTCSVAISNTATWHTALTLLGFFFSKGEEICNLFFIASVSMGERRSDRTELINLVESQLPTKRLSNIYRKCIQPEGYSKVIKFVVISFFLFHNVLPWKATKISKDDFEF